MAVLLTMVLMVAALASSADAAESDSYGGGAQGYAADAPLQTGIIVSLVDKSDNKVQPAKQADLNKMFGVTVDRNKLAVTVASEDLENQTYVATSGTFDVLVSNQNGSVSEGDYLTMSSVDGIAMKAGTDEKIVFGRAVRSFDGKNNSLGTMSLKDTTGKENKTVSFGLVPTSIDIKKNPNEKSTKTKLPDFLVRIGEAVAEKPIGPLRIYLSLAITGISLITAIVLLYSGVRNSLVSIGRNPLSKKMIFRGLLQIILTSIIVLVIGLFAVYLLLKL